jgi:hypothetical protein
VSSSQHGQGRASAGSRAEASESADVAGISRREFAKRAGASSAAAAGLVWAAPKISTIRYVTKAAAGSRPPTSTTTGSVPVGPLGGQISVSATSPCVGADVRVIAAGFAASAPIALQIDSAAHAIGIAQADADGAIDAVVTIPASAPTGPRNLLAVGPPPGGGTLTLTTPITIKTAAECTEQTSSTPVGAAGNPAAPDGSSGSGSLPLTGSDAIDLAIIGGATAIAGRALYGAARGADKQVDDRDR